MLTNQRYIDSLFPHQLAVLLGSHVPIGKQPETGDIFFTSDRDRYAGTYILGVQGMGKSGLLENMIGHCIKRIAPYDQAVIVIDPHGDLVDHCIAQMEYKDLTRAYLLDMTDLAWPFSINLFTLEHPNDALAMTQAIDRIMHIFEVQWPDIMKAQQHLPRYLRAASLVLLSNPGSTFLDMHRLLIDDGYRKQQLKACRDESVCQFWHNYDQLSASMKHQQVDPLSGRLESFQMARPVVQGILGQSEATIDFRKVIENKEIIFIKLPIKTLSQDARLIGTMLVAQIHAALFSFGDVPDQQRPGVNLFIDEFQNFATQDITELFTEGRKFGMKLTVAHQFRQQLPDYLQHSTMTARTKIVFQPQPADATEMARVFPSAETTMKADDLEPKPVEYLLAHRTNNPTVAAFIETYLYPLQKQKQGGTVEIKKPGFRAQSLVRALLQVKEELPPVKVADPTQRLNRLLLEVMESGNLNVVIESQIVDGFANCGRGFYGDFTNSFKRGKLLAPDIEYPYPLVMDNGIKREWTRKPVNGMEQLYHFLFHLRALMSHLAAEPIGKKTSLSSSDVAHMMLQLPPRAIFIRSNDQMAALHTLNTAPQIDGAALTSRIELIRNQTRQKYCRHIEPPDAAKGSRLPQSPKPKPAPKASPWEVI